MSMEDSGPSMNTYQEEIEFEMTFVSNTKFGIDQKFSQDI